MTGERVTIRFRCGLRLSIDTIMEARKLKLLPHSVGAWQALRSIPERVPRNLRPLLFVPLLTYQGVTGNLSPEPGAVVKDIVSNAVASA